MARDQIQTDMTDLARRMQALFNLSEGAAPQIDHVAKAHQDMVRQTETFARSWVERRQEAAETGMQALREMSASGPTDPVTAMAVMADWQRGSVARMTADLHDWVAMCTGLAQTAAPGGGDTATRPDGGQTESGRGKGGSASNSGSAQAKKG